MKAVPQSPRQVFDSRTQTIFYSMRKRFAGKVSQKTGKCIRQHRDLPFDLNEFRAHCLVWFQYSAEALAYCRYCNQMLTSGDFQCDHDVPVSRGGAIGLDNLVCACSECNLEKSQLTGDEFRKLKDILLMQFDREARINILSRLRMGAGYRRLMIQSRKAEKVTVVPHIRVPAEKF